MDKFLGSPHFGECRENGLPVVSFVSDVLIIKRHLKTTLNISNHIYLIIKRISLSPEHVGYFVK